MSHRRCDIRPSATQAVVRRTAEVRGDVCVCFFVCVCVPIFLPFELNPFELKPFELKRPIPSLPNLPSTRRTHVAGMASNDDRDRVLAATDLLSIVGEVVALRPKGREHVGLCPFHDDRSPSMAVVTHKGGYGADAFYKCFACGAGGNAFDFVMNYHKLEFREALKYLADRAGIELTPWEGARTARRDGEPTRDEILRAN